MKVKHSPGSGESKDVLEKNTKYSMLVTAKKFQNP